MLAPAFQGCGCGKVGALPGLLQSRGRSSHQMAAHAESARDFTRAFSGCTAGKGDILLLVATSGGEPPPRAEPPAHIVCSAPATHGDVSAPIVDAATAAFRTGVLKPALLAAGGAELGAVAGNDKALASLCARVIGSCTVGAAMDVLMEHGCMPQLFQNKYVVLISGDGGGSGSGDATVRVLTYGFVGDPTGGDRPDTKHTPYVMRLLTENLLVGGGGGNEMHLEAAAAAAAPAAAAATSLQPTITSSPLQVQYSVCGASVNSKPKVEVTNIKDVIDDDGTSGRILAACLQPGSDSSIGGGVSTLLDGPRCEMCGETSNTPRPEPKADRRRQLTSERRRMHRRNNSF